MSSFPPPPPHQQPGQPIGYAMPQTTMPPARPTAVTVIAILVIIFASMGLLCGPLSLLPFFTDLGAERDPISEAMYGNPVVKVWTIGATVVGMLLALINLIAAIQALSLKAWARRAMVKVAVIQIIVGVVGTAVTLLFMIPPLLEAGQTDPAAKAGAVGGIIGGILGLVFSLVLPVLTIYFFTRPHIVAAFDRPEEAWRMPA